MNYKKRFVKFMSDAGVLTFGDFTAKSGRKTPYFVNTGNYSTGEHIALLGEFYADCIIENNLLDEFNVMFGPAYKGIPLSVTTAIAAYKKFGKNYSYCFNRKEAKDHGEGGLFVGHKLRNGDKIVIIEDVITAGTAMRESLPLLKAAAEVEITAVIISVDRMERGVGDLSAIQEVKKEYGIPVYSIINVTDIIGCITEGIIDGKEYLEKMHEYRERYGVS